jgi:hypothetical protein
MRMFGLLAWHGREYTRIAPCFLWIEGWPRQPGGLQPSGLRPGERGPPSSVGGVVEYRGLPEPPGG